ncbi:MAG TPA: hypothetical protein VLV48_00980, partial [Thermoanaerobaculia bacterium]|nr:hypothetical protein [Thermoanaerobaculia bacterium]
MNLNFPSLRRMLAGLALVILAPLPLLAQPSARTTPAMIFDEVSKRAILFGGVSPGFIRGDETFARDYIDETWAWNGRRWLQLFPETRPSGRGGAAFVWDSFANRGILFGGVVASGLPIGDTWEYRNGAWRQLEVPNQPSARKYAAATFDRVRNRMILHGGVSTTVGTDADGDETRTDQILRDTWEFDGTTWTRTVEQGPDVAAPVIVYDGTRDTTYLVGMKTDSTTAMYRYTGSGWEAITPATLPICLSRASAVWQAYEGNVVLYGGACVTGLVPGVTWEWDGTNWKAVEGGGSAGRVFGHAMAYDQARGESILFGGTDIDVGTEVNFTYKYRASKWQGAFTVYSPGPRSLFGFTTDPENDAVWLYGGVRGSHDLWKYAFGQWTQVFAADQPANCSYPLTVWDTDRKTMVMVCADASVKEFDGTKWKVHAIDDKRPSTSIQASLVYDPTLKKTIIYGGYDGNYLNETWTWDGTKWTKIDGKKPHYRALASMFYDPISKKTILYGGLGRTDRDGGLVRFADTWSFNGKDWVEMTGVNSPPARYGAAVAYNPADNKVHLFGGSNEKVEF